MADMQKMKLEAQEFIKKLAGKGSMTKEDIAFHVQNQYAFGKRWSLGFIEGLINYGFVTNDEKTGVLNVPQKDDSSPPE